MGAPWLLSTCTRRATRRPRRRNFSCRKGNLSGGARERATHERFGWLRLVELLGKAPEPGREEQQLVDLVSGHLRGVPLGRREDVARELLRRAALGGGARRGALRAHAAAADEVEPVVALGARHAVAERELLDGEAEATELLSQPLEPLELVAVVGRALELEPLGRRLHLRAQRVHRLVARTLEEGAGERELPLVVLHAAGGHARP